MLLAQKKFDSEVDMFNIIKSLRVSKFLSKMETNKRQRTSIPYFRRYTITDYDIILDERRMEKEKEMLKALDKNARSQLEQTLLETEKESVIEGCKPESEANDRRILFELTGRRFSPNDFPQEDETSEEEDLAVQLMDLVGFEELSDEEEGGGSGVQAGLLPPRSKVD